jgi:hypothetical protein
MIFNIWTTILAFNKPLRLIIGSIFLILVLPIDIIVTLMTFGISIFPSMYDEYVDIFKQLIKGE